MKLNLYTLTIIIATLSWHSAFSEAPENYEKMPFLNPYEQLLKKHVMPHTRKKIKGTGVDYLAWQKDPLHEEAMQLLEKTDLSKITSKEEKISFWINTYNLLTIDLIIDHGEQETIHNLGGLVGDPWNEFSWVIDGLEITLGQIHQQTLRNIGEPRVHFALTCAALSCPDLLSEPYWPQLIYTRLEKQTRHFLKNKKKGVTIIKAPKTTSRIQENDKFKVSQIFQWFKNDFDHGNIERFVQRYVFLYGAEFDGHMQHNWNLNALKGKEPKTTKKDEVEKSNM